MVALWCITSLVRWEKISAGCYTVTGIEFITPVETIRLTERLLKSVHCTRENGNETYTRLIFREITCEKNWTRALSVLENVKYHCC